VLQASSSTASKSAIHSISSTVTAVTAGWYQAALCQVWLLGLYPCMGEGRLHRRGHGQSQASPAL
jgi:hypothetical protein